jgi:hypothetical protein
MEAENNTSAISSLRWRVFRLYVAQKVAERRFVIAGGATEEVSW